MKALAGFFFFILSASIPSLCDAGSTLSNDEAEEIITAYFTYPIAVSMQITFQERTAEMLDYLKKEGYIVDPAVQTCCGDFFAATEKGKPHFGDFIKYFSDRTLRIDCVYAKKVMKSIETIRLDTKEKRAIVEYIEGIEPNEPVYSAVFRKSREGPQEIDFDETQKKRVKLIYSGKGWRVEK